MKTISNKQIKAIKKQLSTTGIEFFNAVLSNMKKRQEREEPLKKEEPKPSHKK